MLSSMTFRFLNEEHEVIGPRDWNNGSWHKLWLYNLHYFDDLDAIGAEARAAWHHTLIERWLVENPPPHGNGWEPYCLSLRIVNWCRFAWRGGRLTPEAIQSLAVQLRALEQQLEVHLLGNHLFENAKALVFGGLFFEGREADRWLAVGVSYLARELKEQILADGGHFERSPMYHNIITGDVLELLEADRMCAGHLPPNLRLALRRSAEAMVSWAELMSHPDGEVSFFNDSAMGIAPPAAVLRDWAQQLGLAPVMRTGERLVHLPASGYVRACVGRAVLLADVGEVGPRYLPGHAHADTLSCELSLGGVRVLVNTGVSTYAGPQRYLERATAAHNTVQLDGQDSSEVWASFRVARRARPRDVWVMQEAEGVSFGAAHDGFRRFGGDAVHARTWQLGAKGLRVCDDISGRWSTASAYWHLHPNVGISQASDRSLRFRWPRGGMNGGFTGGAVTVEPDQWAPEFGARVTNSRIRLNASARALTSAFTW